LRAEQAQPPVAQPGGLVGDDLRDVQARQREVRTGLLERQVRGVVRADEEVRAGPGEPVRADRQGFPDGLIVTPRPGGQAAGERDAVERYVRMVGGTRVAGALLAEDPEAQRGAFRGGCENAEVLHGASTIAVWPRALSSRSLRCRYQTEGAVTRG